MIRPCRHTLGATLRSEWIGHLCGLCLALRDGHGQLARAATNYDGLLISVLVQAQIAGSSTRAAGPCPLRGMRTATVATGEGARLAAVVSLVLASATLADHAADGDGVLARRSVARVATRLAGRWARHAHAGAADLGLDTAVLLDAVARQPEAERVPSSLLAVTEPTETATGTAFAHTAVLAGRPANIAPLTEAGRLFGRLAHLLDAVEDLAADERSGAWNPLAATGTDLVTARRHADDAVLGVRLALDDVEWAGRAQSRLAHKLLVHELERSVGHAFAHADRGPTRRRRTGSRPAGSSAAARPRSGCSAPARCAAPTSSPAPGRASRAREPATTAAATAATAATGAVTVATAATATADQALSSDAPEPGGPVTVEPYLVGPRPRRPPRRRRRRRHASPSAGSAASLAAGADVEVVAPEVTPAVEGMAAAGELRWTARPYAPATSTAPGTRSPAPTTRPSTPPSAPRPRERRVFCVRADDAPGGSAVTPAVGHARRAHRRRAGRATPAPVRRRAHRARRGAGRRDSSTAVPTAPSPVRPGVALVGGGPGDPELITVRGRRLLARADVVVTDRLGPRDLLDQLDPHVEVIDASKIPYGRAMNQARINELLVEHARAGKFVVRLKGGDPYVFGRGFEEVLACAEAGVPVTVVPGRDQRVRRARRRRRAGAATAGWPTRSSSCPGTSRPDDPRSLVDWDALARLRGTLVLMMAVERIGAFAAGAARRRPRPADTPVASCRTARTRIQRTVRATLADGRRGGAGQRRSAPPAVVVIGAGRRARRRARHHPRVRLAGCRTRCSTCLSAISSTRWPAAPPPLVAAPWRH